MITLYDPLDEIFLEDNNTKPPLRHLMSDLMDELGYQDKDDFNNALLRSFEICCMLKIPISENFKKIYRFRDNVVEVEWQVSDLGCYLLLINGNTRNPNVARAQLHAITARLKKDHVL
jgi:hypothetical protein